MSQTRIVTGSEGVAAAARQLKSGNVVAFPTETVFGLGADARNAKAVAKIYAAKGRPSTNPLIVHVADQVGAKEWVEWSELAEELTQRFWPGPLTLVLPRKEHPEGKGISPTVSAGLGTVAVRCPQHPVALELLKAFKGPVAAPSANRSGFVSPTSAQHVLAELSGRIPMILDSEKGSEDDCSVGVESTVLDISKMAEGGKPIILRPGGVTREMIAAMVGDVEEFQGHVAEHQAAASPGMLEKHYAPQTLAHRFTWQQWGEVQRQARKGKWGKVILLTWDSKVALPSPHETMLMPSDAMGYAHHLYGALREADEQGQKSAGSSILVLLPDNKEGLWAAVHDRLRRATTELNG